MRSETTSVKTIVSVWLPFVLEGHMEKKHIMMSLEEIKQTILTTLPVFHSLSMSSIDTTCTCLFFIKKGSLQHGTLELGKTYECTTKGPLTCFPNSLMKETTPFHLLYI